MLAFIVPFLCCLAFIGKVEGGNGTEFKYSDCKIPDFLSLFQPLNRNACAMVQIKELCGHLAQIAGLVVRFCDDQRKNAKAAEGASEPSDSPNTNTTTETAGTQFENTKDDNTSVTTGDYAIQLMFVYYIRTKFPGVRIVAEETINGLDDPNYQAAEKLLFEIFKYIKDHRLSFEEHESWFAVYLGKVNIKAIVELTNMAVKDIPFGFLLVYLDMLDATRELLRGDKNKLAVTSIITIAVWSTHTVKFNEEAHNKHVPFAGILFEHFPAKTVDGVTPPGRMTCVFDYLVDVYPSMPEFLAPNSDSYVPVSTGNLIAVTQLMQYVPDAWAAMQAVISNQKVPNIASAVEELNVEIKNLYLSGGAGKKSILLGLNSDIAAAVWPQSRCSQHDIAFLLVMAKPFKLKVTNGKGESISLIYETPETGVIRPDGVIATKIMEKYVGWHEKLVEARKKATDEIVKPYNKWVANEVTRRQKKFFNDEFLAKQRNVENEGNKPANNLPSKDLVNAMLSIEAAATGNPAEAFEGELEDIRKAQLEWYTWIKNCLREHESLNSARNAYLKYSKEFQDYFLKHLQSSTISSVLVECDNGIVTKLMEDKVTAKESIEECEYKYQQAQISAKNALQALSEFKVKKTYEDNPEYLKACQTALEKSITDADTSRSAYILAKDNFCKMYNITSPAS